uniref:Uncharacterized protein n=1 Tax=Timema shepardi TaxID=629360 RepID=A0A7R9G3A9_TIMSH|nr:unnamed protein product [Timema shepardi]
MSLVSHTIHGGDPLYTNAGLADPPVNALRPARWSLWLTHLTRRFTHSHWGLLDSLVENQELSTWLSLSDTFGRAKSWVKELQRQASPNIVIALSGNKADLANKRMVEYEEAQAYAEENGLLFMETSAKTAMNSCKSLKDCYGQVTHLLVLFRLAIDCQRSPILFSCRAKKLPKNEQISGAGTSGQGRRLVESEGQQKAPGNCCK